MYLRVPCKCVPPSHTPLPHIHLMRDVLKYIHQKHIYKYIRKSVFVVSTSGKLFCFVLFNYFISNYLILNMSFFHGYIRIYVYA